nr:pyrimidine-specific ribonucleoside hydrolase RihA [Desulfobacterales bacterium]
MKKVLLDCDPGHDDAVAIMLACASNELEVKGITTVAGNQTGEKTFQNALKVLSLIREELPIARGLDVPLLRELVTAPDIHGETGLDGAALPDPRVEPVKSHAVNFIVESVLSSREAVYVISTGPLGNIASALLIAPAIKEKIERIVLMGGGVFDSNVTPAAEFNVYVDPE